MPKVRIEELTRDAFAPFGTFANMLNPDTEAIGESPSKFHRDMVLLPTMHPQSLTAFSTCRVEKRPLVVDVTEYHSYTAEGNLPLDADALIHVGPATANGIVPWDKIRIFRVPRGTFVTTYPGVWHHAPFAHGADVLNMLIVLPERTYANDCVVVEATEAQKVYIEA